MIAVRPMLTTRRGGGGFTARAVAAGYAEHVSALWRGEPAARAFGDRLRAAWAERLPPRPAAAPDAVSPHGAGGRGIAWYDTEDGVLGYVPGLAGGYRLPAAAEEPRPDAGAPSAGRAAA